MSAVTDRYSASAPPTDKVLENAEAAVTRALEAVSLLASTSTAKNPPVKHSKQPSEATPELSKLKRKLSAVGRKAIAEAARKRRAAVKAARRPEPAVAKKAVVKTAPVKVAGTVPAAVETAAQ
jgi:hypothetical protein